MSGWYRFFYWVGFTPWESDADTAAPQLQALLDSEAATRGSSPGRALDLGCGTGRWSLELARRGWEVTGIDVVPKAIRKARERAKAANADIAFVEGDVTALRQTGIGSGFSLFLDVECFNHLNDRQRLAAGREIEAIATPDATLLLLGWSRAHRGPLPPGVDGDGLRSAFPAWRIVEEHAFEGALPPPLRGIAPRWYRLAHSSQL